MMGQLRASRYNEGDARIMERQSSDGVEGRTWGY